MIISIVKVLTVVLILGVMILMLITVNHYLGGGFNSSDTDTDRLRDDISAGNDGITGESVLSELVRVRDKSWLRGKKRKPE